MSAPVRISAIDLEINQLCDQWRAQAEEAVRLGLRMAERLIQLERQRDDLRIDLRIAQDRVVELETELGNAHGLLRMATGERQ